MPSGSFLENILLHFHVVKTIALRLQDLQH